MQLGPDAPLGASGYCAASASATKPRERVLRALLRPAVLLIVLAAGIGAAVWLLRADTASRPVTDAALLAAGRTLFQQHCGACHVARTTRISPGLGGLFGRPAGVTGFANSPALRSAGFVWDADRLDAFLADPRGYIPDNQMVFFGLDDAQDRAALIAYIKAL